VNICFHANCQCDGLQYFFERSPDAGKISTKVIRDFQVVLGETSRDEERRALGSADIIFYHAIKGAFPVSDWLPKQGVKLIPMSVWYNSGPFLSGATSDSWNRIVQYARNHTFNDAVHHAVHDADMGYSERWAANLQKIIAKETREKVPEATRISSWTAEGIETRMHLTMNHPTTLVFIRWANLLLDYIGLKRLCEDEWMSRDTDGNMVGLPCEDFACSGAFNHLGLGWGGDEASNLWNYEFAKKKLKEMTLAANNTL
jgi:hypothetical protein